MSVLGGLNLNINEQTFKQLISMFDADMVRVRVRVSMFDADKIADDD